MRLATISDELEFEVLPTSIQELVKRLARSGYLGTPLHVDEQLNDQFEAGYKEGKVDGRDDAKAELESELEQILCSDCFDAVCDAS